MNTSNAYVKRANATITKANDKNSSGKKVYDIGSIEKPTKIEYSGLWYFMYGNNTKIDATINVSLPPVIHSNPIKENAKKSSSRPQASNV